VEGWLDVDGVVRPPFGIDQRFIDQTGNTGWVVTHLSFGLTVVAKSGCWQLRSRWWIGSPR
jgi:hypothetical protein